MIIVYKKNLIYFSVLFVFTEKNNLYIILDPYLKVIVLAANQVSILEIRIAIKKKANLIIQKKLYLQYLLNPVVSYIYLGRKFRLCVVKSDSNYVKLYNGIIYVCSTSTSNSIKINSAVNNWYRKRAKIKFNERLRECLLHLTARRTIEIPDLIIKLNPLNKKISCYYESCNVLLLNMNLIRTPIFFIDYVIYHSIFFLILKRKNCNFISLLPENIKKKILFF